MTAVKSMKVKLAVVCVCVLVSDEDEELCAVHETSHVGHVDADTSQRLYARQQISFTVCGVTLFL